MTYNRDILEILNTKRPFLTFSENLIAISINEVEQKIKNYCSIPEVPKALYYTWSNMVLDLLDYQNAVIDDNTSTDVDITDSLMGNFGSISLGDSSWKQETPNNSNSRYKALSSHNPILDDLIMNYKSDLNRFRRIW